MVNLSIRCCHVTITACPMEGHNYCSLVKITILGSEFGGSVTADSLTATAAAFAEDITLTVGAVLGVGTVSYTSGTENFLELCKSRCN